MSIKLTKDQISRIMLIVNRQFNIGRVEDLVGNQEFFYAGSMKPVRYDVKLGYSILDDCFVAWDYKDGSVAQAFIDDCMQRTTITVKAKVEDHGIYILWQGKWRFIKEYYPKRTVPAEKTCTDIKNRFKLAAGLPNELHITLDFNL